jgi:SAM-dependent methyltransferase
MDFNKYKHSYCQTIEKSLRLTGKEHDFFTRIKAESLHDIIKQNFAHLNEPYLLDVGCGHGLIHKHLKHLDLKLAAVEVAHEVLPLAKQLNPEVTYFSHDGKTLPFEENTFDLTFAICVMHHVPPDQWPAFLLEMKRVLKPGGMVVIFEHNPYNPLTRYIVANNVLDEDAVLLSSRKLKKLMCHTGFSNEKSRNILFTPFSHPLFRWVDNKLGWCPIGAQYYATGVKS